MARILAFALGTLIFAAGTAAQANTAIDTDGDGMYSFNEMLAVMPTLTEEVYSSVDTNADGSVDADELAAAQDAGVLPATDG